MSEMAVVSSRKAKIKAYLKTKPNQAKQVLHVMEEPGAFLSTVQIGITMIGILSGAFGEATLSKSLASFLSRIPLLQPYAKDISLILIVFLITYLSIVLGELVPKRIALRHPEPIALKTAFLLKFLGAFTLPFVKLLSFSTTLLLKIMNIKANQESTISNNEINLLMEEGQHSGVFNEHERLFVANILKLDERRVTSIMTPKSKIEFINANTPLNEQIKQLKTTCHTRLPVLSHAEEILGIMDIKSALISVLEDQHHRLLTNLHAPIFFPENGAIMQLLEIFKKNKLHLALIVDEYGDLQGLVTLNDVLGALVGEVEGNSLPEDSSAIMRHDGSWLMDGNLPLDEVCNLLQTETLFDSNQPYHTLAGYLLHLFGHIPKSSDCVESELYRFEIIDMDGTRIDKVLIQTKPIS